MLSYLEYLGFRIWIGLFRIMPFRLLYIISDILAFLLFHVIRYRRAVSSENIRRCLINLDEKSRHKILKLSYHNLADILLESVKGMTISKATLRKRFKFENIEMLDPYYEECRSLILVSGHVCNWEWGAIALGLQLKHDCIGIYKPIKNPFIEAYAKKRRGRTGMILAGIKETGRVLQEQAGRPSAFVLIADQNPANKARAFWLDFFSHATAFHHGPASISKNMDYPVVYFSIKRIHRGYYSVYFESLVETPLNMTPEEIMQRYVKRLEQQIEEQPSDWLWSHRRWKNKKSEFVTGQTEK